MKYLPGISQHTKPLSCSSGNRAEVLLKGHLSIKYHPQYNKVSRLLWYSSIQSQWGCPGMNCVWPVDYHSLHLTRIQFHSPQVTPHTNVVQITI